MPPFEWREKYFVKNLSKNFARGKINNFTYVVDINTANKMIACFLAVCMSLANYYEYPVVHSNIMHFYFRFQKSNHRLNSESDSTMGTTIE